MGVLTDEMLQVATEYPTGNLITNASHANFISSDSAFSLDCLSISANVYTKQDVVFFSKKKGERIAAWLYMPIVLAHAVPCVVMANGISLTRNDGILGYAEAFAKAGIAALVFDYTSFGDSTGVPRQGLSITGQRKDYKAAIEFAKKQPGIHPGAIVLWGYSFACGHIVHIANEDPSISAVICVAPFIKRSGVVSKPTFSNIAKAVVKDSVNRILKQDKVVRYPVVGPPGSAAVITSEEGIPGFEQVVASHSKWSNEVTVRGLYRFPLDHPIHLLKFLKVPVLFCVGSYDQTAPPEPILSSISKVPRGSVKEYNNGHFDIHQNSQVKRDQVEFLTTCLRKYLIRL